VSHDPRRTVVTGASFGGLTALFALARAPQSIGAASAQSVSLWRYPAGALAQPMADALTAGPLMPRIRLHAGRYEGSMGARARDLAEDLAQRTGHRVPVRMHSGGHDWAWWQPALIEDLIEFLGDPPEG
jgi:enterochelin esterase family protein